MKAGSFSFGCPSLALDPQPSTFDLSSFFRPSAINSPTLNRFGTAGTVWDGRWDGRELRKPNIHRPWDDGTAEIPQGQPPQRRAIAKRRRVAAPWRSEGGAPDLAPRHPKRRLK